MAALTTMIDVARSPQEVFAYVTDPTRFSEWQQGVLDGSMDGDRPQAVGEKCLTRRRIGFAERPVTSELTHIDPPRRWEVRGVDGPIRASVRVTVTPLDEGRRSNLQIDLEFAGHGIGKLLVPLVRPSARKEMPTNLQRLKERLETA